MKRLFDTFQGGVVEVPFRLLPMEGLTPWLVNSPPPIEPDLFGIKAMGCKMQTGMKDVAAAATNASSKMLDLKKLLDKLSDDSTDDDEDDDE